jgi:hypothetical protein
MKKNTIVALMVACVAFVAMPARADHHDGFGPHGGGFVARGAQVRSLPRGGYEINHPSGRYWYHGGNWYAPRGPRWIVVAPPFGVYVPILPGFYSTLWFGGVPYYYANDVYYLWRAERNAYEVVPPPEGAAESAAVAPVDLYIYPRNGQTEAQQSEDRYQCHRWAADQTHFDPTQVAGGAAAGNPTARSDYFRAMSACLEGRGYTVK